MRITDKIIQNRVLRGIQEAAGRLSKTQTRIATNKNITRPSDDPPASAKLMNYHRDLRRIEQTIKNGESTSTLLSYTDTVLERLDELVNDVRSEAVAMATDTVDESARLAVANEMQIIIDQVLNLANTQFAGRYIFGGHKLLDKPYQINGSGDIEYVGDSGEIRHRIELSNETIVVNVPGSRVFGSGSSSDGLFKVLKDLKSALESNDTAGIQNSLTLIDNEIDNLASIRGELGVKMNRTQSAMDELNILKISLTGEISQIEEVDMAQEAGKYIADQEAYQAALNVASTILKLPSLVDYFS